MIHRMESKIVVQGSRGVLLLIGMLSFYGVRGLQSYQHLLGVLILVWMLVWMLVMMTCFE